MHNHGDATHLALHADADREAARGFNPRFKDGAKNAALEASIAAKDAANATPEDLMLTSAPRAKEKPEQGWSVGWACAVCGGVVGVDRCGATAGCHDKVRLRNRWNTHLSN